MKGTVKFYRARGPAGTYNPPAVLISIISASYILPSFLLMEFLVHLSVLRPLIVEMNDNHKLIVSLDSSFIGPGTTSVQGVLHAVVTTVVVEEVMAPAAMWVNAYISCQHIAQSAV